VGTDRQTGGEDGDKAAWPDGSLMDHLLHRPRHARALKENVDARGLESCAFAPEADVMPSEEIDLVSFFLAHLYL